MPIHVGADIKRMDHDEGKERKMKERKMILRLGVPAVPSPDAGFLYFATQKKVAA